MKNKVKIGDVLLNEHASERNPLRISIVYEITKDEIHGIYIYKGKITKVRYLKSDVNSDDAWKVINHIDIIKEIEQICQQ